jgi:hypothetical protein
MGRIEIELAVIVPLESLVPTALTHLPTVSALSAALSVLV